MAALRPGEPFAFPAGFETWWSTPYSVPPSSIDELGHMTAVHYPVALEYATAAFLTDALQAQPPEYVMAELNIHYRREVTLAHSPASVHVRLTLVGRTTFAVEMVLVDSEGVACTRAAVRYVAWDAQARTKRPLDPDQHGALQRCLDLTS